MRIAGTHPTQRFKRSAVLPSWLLGCFPTLFADAIKNLKSYVESRASRRIEVVAKVGGKPLLQIRFDDATVGGVQPWALRHAAVLLACWACLAIPI